MIDKLRPPKVTPTTPEAYLQLPEDSEEFPIKVDDDDSETEDFSGDGKESNESYESNALDSASSKNEDL